MAAPIPAARRQAGFTLVEVMVSITIGLIVMAGLATLFAGNSRTQQDNQDTTQQLESGRYALDAFGNDLRHAGFYGEFNPLDLSPTLTDPDPCSTDLAALGWDTAATPVRLPVAVRGTPAGTALPCLAERLAGTEAITVRRVATTEQAIATIVTDNLYVQVSRCADDVQQIVAATASGAFTLRNIACTGAVDAVRRYVSRTYYVARCNDCDRGDTIPTLKRAEFVNGVLRTTAIAEGVENLQVEWGVDTSATRDGRPEEYVAAAEVDGTPAARVWDNVVSARVHLLSRNVDPSAGHHDLRTYRLGPVSYTPATDAPAAAAYKRTLLTETVRLVNVGDRFDR